MEQMSNEIKGVPALIRKEKSLFSPHFTVSTYVHLSLPTLLLSETVLMLFEKSYDSSAFALQEITFSQKTIRKITGTGRA